MSQSNDVTLQIGAARITVPGEAAARAYLEKYMLPVEQIHGFEPRKTLPSIGEPYLGGDMYAGLTIHDNKPAALILLPEKGKGLTWAAAGEWAKKQGGELPSRVDALLLFQRLKREFEEEAYWTSDQHAGDDDCAWTQGFSYGYQDLWLKSYELRARAVRRIVI